MKIESGRKISKIKIVLSPPGHLELKSVSNAECLAIEHIATATTFYWSKGINTALGNFGGLKSNCGENEDLNCLIPYRDYRDSIDLSADYSQNKMPMSLGRRENRTQRAMTIVSLKHIPDTLKRLEMEEKRLSEEFHSAFTVKDLCSITSALDTIRERRRILLGIPLPGSRSGKDTRIHRTIGDATPAKMVDVQLSATPEVDIEQPGQESDAVDAVDLSGE